MKFKFFILIVFPPFINPFKNKSTNYVLRAALAIALLVDFFPLAHQIRHLRKLIFLMCDFVISICTSFCEHDWLIKNICNIFVERIIELKSAVSIYTKNIKRRTKFFYQFEILSITVYNSNRMEWVDIFTSGHCLFE